MREIATLTMNPAIDLFVVVDRVVEDAKLRCRDVRRDPGGGGVNVARAVVRLGGGAWTVFPAGGDSGTLLTRLLERDRVPTVPVASADPVRENLTVSEQDSGRQFRFVLPGAALDPGEQKRLLETVLDRRPDYLVASGSLPPGVPPEFYAELAERARGVGARVVLDTSGEALRQGLKGRVFLVKPNRRELAELAGREFLNDREQEQAALALVDQGEAEIVVVSLGALGVLLVTGSGAERVASPDVPIRSRVGAGDSMVAGITLGLARGEEIATAVRFGVAAGAAAAMTPGTELCRREDVERLFAGMRP